MIDVVLRAAAPDFDVDAFLARFPELRPSAVWRKGERRFRSRPPSEDSGFNCPLGEGDTWTQAWSRTQATLARIERALAGLREARVPMSVDFGVMVGLPDAYVPSLGWTPEALKFFAARGLGIEVTCYPVDEEKVEELSHDAD